jgi:hypothetical protein
MLAVTRGALKGYTYQHFVYWLLISKMDVDRDIQYIEVEKDVSHNFDDCYLESVSEKYYFQVKNEKNKKGEMISLDEIKINDEKVILPSYTEINYEKGNINILILNTNKIETNTEILGLPAYKLDSIYIIPLTTDKTEEIVENMYRNDERINIIRRFAYETTINGIFQLNINDLPELTRFSTELDDETVILRNRVPDINSGLLLITGKPGVGKSHFVNEIIDKVPHDILYRFWTSSQDNNKINRLGFNEFLRDIGIGVFNSPKSFEYSELIDKINTEKLTIIIDGLDHVENYNPLELDKFISFIDAIDKAKVLVLSRPLKRNLNWEENVLENWDMDQTKEYLTKAHDISEYSLIRKIYEISDGYPIITYFLAEHYNLHGEILIDEKISGLNDYYDILISDVKLKALSIFLLNDYFFLESELETLLDDYSAELVKEFVEEYPYLFNVEINRISLIHDSLNTFLREKDHYYLNLRSKIIPKIEDSIENLDIRFLSRIDGFDFEDEFLEKILKKYSDIELFKSLSAENSDWESIKEFYQKLKKILENYPNLFDIYQYYSFILILLIVERNDLIGYHDIIYHSFLYMDNHGIDKEFIFSNGVCWKLYLYYKYDNPKPYLKLLNERHFSKNEFCEVIETVEEESNFFNILNEDFDDDEFFKEFEKKDYEEYDKKDNLIEAFVRIKINDIDGSKYLKTINRFLEHGFDSEVENDVKKICREFGIREFFKESIMFKMKYRLSELGVIKTDNIFLEKSLKEIINDIAPQGSFEVHDYVLSYLRLANHENWSLNINELNQFYSMYYGRKDYTVLNINDALMVFEEKTDLNEMDSFNLIESVMRQSEKGIRHLLTDYLNEKEPEFIERLLEQDDFNHNIVDIFDLEPRKIDLFSLDDIDQRMTKIFDYHGYDHKIKYQDVANGLKSKYGDAIRDLIGFCKFSVDEVPKNEIHLVNGVDYSLMEDEESEDNEITAPFEDGHISIDDLQHIVENNIESTEIAKYTDGWNHAFHYMELFEHYDHDNLNIECLEIIHNAMFSRAFLDYFGLWNYFLGNIPVFLNMIDYDTDWDKLYSIFTEFLQQSSIGLK